MAHSPQVLLLDDGELDDVQRILDQEGVSYGRVRGGAIAPNTPPPTRLLVATPRRVESVHVPDVNAPEADGVVRIVVVNEDSPTLRAHLREVGFDYLVRRPVHPEALRLLLMHCVYTGEERRSEPRIPVGFEVSFRTGLLPRRATLADLSTRGARLVSRWPLEPGKRITITVPERAGVPESISVRGRVLRMSLDQRNQETPYSAAVAFEQLPAETRQELEWILEERARGPATLPTPEEPSAPRDRKAGQAASEASIDPPETRADDLRHGISVDVDVRLEVAEDAEPEMPPEAARAALARDVPQLDAQPGPKPSGRPGEDLLPPEHPRPAGVAPLAAPAARLAAPAPAPGAAPTDPSPAPPPAQPQPKPQGAALSAERRGEPRGTYQRRVPAFGDRAMRVLVARDLSMFGMRIERESTLELGDRLHLAIYGSADEEPFLVWATVERVDGADGMYLRFDELHPVIAAQLEGVVAGLPAVESLHDDEAAAMGTVVTEILNS
jgi:hypothetical protein